MSSKAIDRISYDDCTCDDGKHYNNADPSSGQWVECTECDWEHQCQHEESECGICNDCGDEVDWVARKFK